MKYLELGRRQKGWSQDTLSSITGISQPLISLMEVGRGLPTDKQRKTMSAVLGIPPEILLHDVEISDVIETRAVKAMAAR